MPAPVAAVAAVAAVARAIAVSEGALSGNTNHLLPARHAIPMIVPSSSRSRALRSPEELAANHDTRFSMMAAKNPSVPCSSGHNSR
jgi:hypothetical protein